MKKTTIQVSEKLRIKLESLGSKKDTYETIIWRLIKRAYSRVRKK